MRTYISLCVALIVCCALPCAATRIGATESGPVLLKFNGTAFRLDDGAIRLTNNTYSQGGSVFTSSPVWIGQFDTKFSFRFHGCEEYADGLTFCIHNDPAGAGALGSIGGYLGYGVSEHWGTPGIVSSIAVEFDNYYNDTFSDLVTEHIGVNLQGSVASVVQVPSLTPLFARVVNARIVYDGSTLDVYAWGEDELQPNAPCLRYMVDIPDSVGSTSAYVGFTAATATYFQYTDVLSWDFGRSKSIPYSPPYVPGGPFALDCRGRAD